MTTKPNDGGPAFPFQANDKSNLHMQTGGMSLRDYFAGQALTGYPPEFYGPNREGNWSGMAESCYRVADAMIKAREVRDDQA